MSGSVERLFLSQFDVTPGSLSTPGGLAFFASLSPERARALAVPARPDRLADRELHEHWVELVEDVKTVEPAEFAADLGTETRVQLSQSRIETSRNWSGLRQAPSGDNRFNVVVGKWRVPKVRKADAAAPLQPNCSIWVGFGGHRRWSGAMPQLGSEHRAESKDGSKPESHCMWIQWWVRSSTSPPFQAQVLKWPQIARGDVVLCRVELESSRRALFFVRKRGENILYRIVLDMSAATVRGVDAYGSSAEWIVERPRDPASHTLYPLADFGKVKLSRCIARAAKGGQNALKAPRTIRMIEQVPSPQRIVVISKPERKALLPDSFDVHRTGPTP